MKFTPDKIFYLVAISSVVFYMLWNHGNVEFGTHDVAEMTDDTAGMNAAIKAGDKEMKNSDDGEDLTLPVRPGVIFNQGSYTL
tara:strand:+ start:432 stop:680 length:249 start_codon:yes stop_codon:yes gene_type:complete